MANEIKLSVRLGWLADVLRAFAPERASLADIGTDHAYLPVWLTQMGAYARAYACDVNPKPLERAAKSIRRFGVEERVSLVLSNGLREIPETVDVLCFAGMGGRLMTELLFDESENSTRVRTNAELVCLQPQSEWGLVEETLAARGYKILFEDMQEERGKFYRLYIAAKEARDLPVLPQHAEVYKKYWSGQKQKAERLLDSKRLGEDACARVQKEYEKARKELAKWQ